MCLLYGIFFLAFFPLLAKAQSFVNLKFTDTQNMAIIGVSVRLINEKKPSSQQTGTTNQEGNIRLKVEPTTTYRLQATFIGYKPIEELISFKKDDVERIFVLTEDTASLGEVTVTAKKPLITQVDDMSVVDPGPVADISSNAMEVLEKIPGLFIDQDGNIYLSSTTPASVYLNGREQKMSREDIAVLLKNLPPNSIERIEILRTPSAKFDASSSGGLVNVVLKRGFKIGKTGSLSSGYSQGRHGEGRLGINLNNQDGGRTSYFGLNVGGRTGFDQVETSRLFSADSLLTQFATTTSPNQNVFTRFGFGFEPKANWELNLDSRISSNRNTSDVLNQNSIRRVSSSSTTPFSQSENLTDNDGLSWSVNQELSTKYKMDQEGSEWTTELEATYAKSESDQVYNNAFILPMVFNTGGEGSSENQRFAFTAQSDLKYKLPQKITLEVGIKSNWQNIKNNADYIRIQGTTRTPDTFRTRSFSYTENTHAAYLQASKTIGSFVLKSGIRLENANIRGNQTIPFDTTFQVIRTDFFPYAYLSRTLVSISNFELKGFAIYRRSISRPGYSFLNPSPRYLDQYAYEVGNPNLRPQFTTNYELNISVGDMPIFAIGRNDTKDIFTNVVYQDPKNPSVAVRTYDNLGKRAEDYFRLTAAIPPGGRYFFVVGTQYGRNRYDGLYENKPLTFDRGSWSFFTFHMLKLDKYTSLTLNGFMQVNGQQQFYELENFGALNIGITRKFLKDKLNMALRINDILNTQKNHFNLNQGTIQASGFRSGDTRRIGLNIRYNFGFRQKEEKPNMFEVNGDD
ncbi:MAG TPA: TonB-dependent receptor [Rhodothermales bacterium]|nr:TonB-dependent receptor [Rhodothermales bacterium]